MGKKIPGLAPLGLRDVEGYTFEQEIEGGAAARMAVEGKKSPVSMSLPYSLFLAGPC